MSSLAVCLTVRDIADTSPAVAAMTSAIPTASSPSFASASPGSARRPYLVPGYNVPNRWTLPSSETVGCDTALAAASEYSLTALSIQTT